MSGIQSKKRKFLGDRGLVEWGCRMSQVSQLSLSSPVCKMGARRLITYIRATGIQHFVKGSQKTFWMAQHNGSTDSLITQTANSYM